MNPAWAAFGLIVLITAWGMYAEHKQIQKLRQIDDALREQAERRERCRKAARSGREQMEAGNE